MDRPYVDYTYYTSEYSGNKIPEGEFIAFARKASLKMDPSPSGGWSGGNGPAIRIPCSMRAAL